MVNVRGGISVSFNYSLGQTRSCEVCGGEHSSCRIDQRTGNIHCRSLVSLSDNWIFLKEDRIGFGIFQNAKDREDWIEEQCQLSREERERRQLERDREKAERDRELAREFKEQRLPITELDKNLSSLLEQLSKPHQSHAQSIYDRFKIIPEIAEDPSSFKKVIEHYGYRSVCSRERLKKPVDYRVPGVGSSGRNLFCSGLGILACFRNHLRQWIGFQVRLDNPISGNKYPWGKNPQLQTGELPLAYYEPIISHGGIFHGQDAIALVEGTSFKPAIAAERLGIPTFGAAGGLFTSSKQQLKEYLDHCGATPQTQIILPPDGGDVINPQVISRLKNIVSSVQELGYKNIRFLWWNQYAKTSGDIDEIGSDRLQKAKSISPEDFFAKANNRKNNYDSNKFSVKTIDKRHLPLDSNPPEDALIFGLNSARGTGKSYYIESLISNDIPQGIKNLVPGHRISLGRANSSKWGLDYVSDIKTSQTKGLFGIGLCFDSMRKDSKAHFDPQDWEGANIKLDESAQGIWHLLDSSTMAENRVEVLQNFEKVLNVIKDSGGKILLSDADLLSNSPAIELILKLLGIDRKDWKKQVYIIDNKHIPIKRNLFTYESKEALLFAINKMISEGKKCLLHTGSQEPKSKTGTYNLELYYKQLFPDLKILRIDKNTIRDRSHPAYQCTNNINAVLSLFDMVIASPVIETGISIETNQFDFVAQIATGTQTVDAATQTIDRDRSGVDRHIFAPKRGLSFVGNHSTNPGELIKSQKEKTAKNIAALNQAGIKIDNSEEWQSHPYFLECWAKMGAKVNEGMKSYRESIYTKLSYEGYTILEPPGELKASKNEIESVKNALKENRNVNYEAYCYKTETSKTPTNSRLDELKDKQNKTESERLEQSKGELQQLYGIEPDADLVAQHENGLHPKLRLQYYLLPGRQYLPQRDKQKLDSLTETTGSAFVPDINKKLLGASIETLDKINIRQFLQNDLEFSKTSVREWSEQLIKPRLWKEIKNNLGIGLTIDPDQGIANAQRLLNHLGLKLPELRRAKVEGTDKRERIYGAAVPIYECQSRIFQHWLEREHEDFTSQTNQLKERVHPPTCYFNQKTSTPSNADEIKATVSASTPCYRNISHEMDGRKLEEKSENDTEAFINLDQQLPVLEKLTSFQQQVFEAIDKFKWMTFPQIVSAVGRTPQEVQEAVWFLRENQFLENGGARYRQLPC
ncbi:MAG: hypothetical protein QNJ54_36045 [Prochloraceae cyanobacterium]|nr:hypothetical protein [Prochloraceae cyanobacterium]